MIKRLLPRTGDITAEEIIAEARAANSKSSSMASKEARFYCETLSKALLADPHARSFPELQALGFWLRPAAVENMIREYTVSPTETCRTSAGVVFQLPPGNVATLFGYTSSISLLCGNVTVIRLPSAENPVQSLLISLMQESIQQAPDSLRHRLIVLRYGHEDAITTVLSSACDVRMVWGGDETVEHIRQLPLPALSRHVSFGDRYSALAIDTRKYNYLDEAGRTDLIKKIFNDIYLFDQMACSSPRLVVWIGDENNWQKTTDDFYARLTAYIATRGYHIDVGGHIAKLNTTYLALHDLHPAEYKTYGLSLTVITLPDLNRLSSFKSINYGYGTLLTVRLDRLIDLAGYAERRDQTLSHWGIDESEIRQFTELCQGRGFDRIVPAGQASAFDPVWDGYNLFDVMSRLIQVRP